MYKGVDLSDVLPWGAEKHVDPRERRLLRMVGRWNED